MTANTTIVLFVLSLAAVLVGRADVWTLANGDKLTGELVGEDEVSIELQHPQLGRLKLPRTMFKLESPSTAAADPEAPLLADHPDPDVDEGEGKEADKAHTTGAKPKPPAWKRQVELGYSQQSGAKEKQDLSVRLQVDGKRSANTYRATARLLQAHSDDDTVTDRSEASFRWRHDINKRLFTQALTTYSEDNVRKIDLSLEQQFGGGYKIIDGSRHKANVGLGAVIQYLDRQETDQQTALLGSFFQDYVYQWNKRVKVTQESSFMISDTGTLNIRNGVPDGPTEGSYRLKFNTGVQSKVTQQMSLNVRFEYDYDRSVLETNLRADQRLTTSLGYIW